MWGASTGPSAVSQDRGRVAIFCVWWRGYRGDSSMTREPLGPCKCSRKDPGLRGSLSRLSPQVTTDLYQVLAAKGAQLECRGVVKA